MIWFANQYLKKFKMNSCENRLNVSTFVSMLETNIKIDQEKLQSIYDSITPVPYDATLEQGIIKISVLGNSKGLCKKMVYRKSKEPTKNTNTFRNQISSYVRIIEDTELILGMAELTKKNSYYKGERFVVNDNLKVYKRGQTAFQFNSINLYWNDASKVNTKDIIRITTSVARKSQESNLKDYNFKLTDEDIQQGFHKIQFEKGCYANALFVQSELTNNLRVNVEFIIEANMFLFTSGKIKVAGCTTNEQIDKAVNVLVNEFTNQIDDEDVLNAFGIDFNNFAITKRTPVMINCGFSSGYEIKRFELDNIIRNKYKVISSFEPNTHAACIIKYYSNLSYADANGRCQCMEKYGNKLRCIGLGDASKENGCKIVTILVFQSGKIILTGAREYCQVEQGYNFIKKILIDNELDLKRA